MDETFVFVVKQQSELLSKYRKLAEEAIRLHDEKASPKRLGKALALAMRFSDLDKRIEGLYTLIDHDRNW